MSERHGETSIMKNLLSFCLFLSAVLTVSHCTESDGDVIVKDGHRFVVVEYDEDSETNTRVLISPPEKERNEGQVFENAKEKTKETASFTPRVNDQTASDILETPVARAAGDVKEKLVNEVQYVEEKVTKKAHKAQNLWEKAKMAARGIKTVVVTVLKLTKIGSIVGLIGIAAAYGMCVWVTFVSSYVLASVLGRQQFGVVQSKVNAVYFKAISVAILVGLLGHVISRRGKVFTDAMEMWQAVNLLSSILMVEANASFVEPRATKVICNS